MRIGDAYGYFLFVLLDKIMEDTGLSEEGSIHHLTEVTKVLRFMAYIERAMASWRFYLVVARAGPSTVSVPGNLTCYCNLCT